MRHYVPQNYSRVFSKNIESNGRFSGCYHFIIEGDFGKRAESSIYYKIGLDIGKFLSGFEAGDMIVFSVRNEFDFWKRVELKAHSSNGHELFCFKWIMGNEVLRKGIFKESCLSEDGKIEAIELAKIKKLDIIPEEKRTIVVFDKINRTPSSYGARPLVGNILNELESILINRFLERKYAAPFFIINFQKVIDTSPTVFQNVSHVRDFYLKYGYSTSSGQMDFLKKDSLAHLDHEYRREYKKDEDCEPYGMNEIDKELGVLDNFFSEIIERAESSVSPSEKKKSIVPQETYELFEWGDTIEIVDNGRDVLCSSISSEEEKLLKFGMRGLVFSTEKKEDCGMVVCGFKEIGSLYIKIHFSNLRKISKFN